MSIKYIGLDFEASGTNPWGLHVPIQIGIFMEPSEIRKVAYESLVGGWDWSEFEWQEEAFNVHKIVKERVATARPAWKVDIEAAAILLPFVGSHMWNVPVGWGVAGYDQQFIHRWFPNLRKILSRRSVDLNGLIYERAGDSEQRYQQLKKALKSKTQAVMAEYKEPKWHDALYDAEAALVSFNLIREGFLD